jgi:ADP-ribose pyrophosphatase YjhB (NUDIX family)
MILCIDEQGNSILVPAESVDFRPAVYGILIEDDGVMLNQNDVTGLWEPPGGMLSARETPARALVRHLRQTSRKIPRIGPLLQVEDQYRVDRHGRAWHWSILYYALEPSASTAPPRSNPDAADRPKFVSLHELKRSQMQLGFEAIQAARLRLQLA